MVNDFYVNNFYGRYKYHSMVKHFYGGSLYGE